jgi:hypothetical protein
MSELESELQEYVDSYYRNRPLFDVSQFVLGWQDCKEGKPATGDDRAYSAGYGARYWHEQEQDRRTMV